MKSLLPSRTAEFHSKEYWDTFFRKRKDNAFEWYGQYNDLKSIFMRYITPNSIVLNVGCGNSELSSDMYDDGYPDICNIDFSDIVIQEMKKKNNKRKKMEFKLMDMMNMTFSDDSFEVVVDKGALDALFSDNSEEVRTNVDNFFREIERVSLTRKEGEKTEKSRVEATDSGKNKDCKSKNSNRVYICVTLAQPHIIEKLVGYFYSRGYSINIHSLKLKESHTTLHPFVVAIFPSETGGDFQEKSDLKQVIKLEDLGNVEEILNLEDAVEKVRDIQYRRSLVPQLNMSNHARVELMDTTYKKNTSKNGDGVDKSLSAERGLLDSPKYILTIVNLPRQGKIKRAGECACFIVPQGRETEWLFASEEGQNKLAEQIKYNRLIIVMFGRGHTYGDLKSIQKELSPKIVELSGTRSSNHIPFLTTQEGIGLRTPIEVFVSSLSGKIVVEEMKVEGEIFRCLVFVSASQLVQSQVRLIENKEKGADLSNGENDNDKREIGEKDDGSGHVESQKNDTDPSIGKNLIIDRSYLPSYARSIVSGLVFVHKQTVKGGNNVRTLVVGMGAGVVCMYLRTHMSYINVVALELDPVVVEVAKRWFGVVEDVMEDEDVNSTGNRNGEAKRDGSFSIRVGDAMDYIKQWNCDTGNVTDSSSDSKKENGDEAIVYDVGEKKVEGENNEISDARYDWIILEIDSKDLTTGLNAPPGDFITTKSLECYRNMLEPSGLLCINVVSRSEPIFNRIIQDCRKVFPFVLYCEVEECVNRIVYCVKGPLTPLWYTRIAEREAGNWNVDKVISPQMLSQHSFPSDMGLEKWVAKLRVVTPEGKLDDKRGKGGRGSRGGRGRRGRGGKGKRGKGKSKRKR